jgi:PAS domain S-box-containing protein
LNGVILSWNAGAERIYGYTTAEMLGHSIDRIFSPERLDELAQILERLKRGEHTDHYETERVRKDGSPLQISLTVSPIRDAAGTIVAASTIARDITARKRADDELLAMKDRLAADLAAMTRLHELSAQLLATSELQPLLEEALAATIALQGADFGNIQLYNQQTGALEIIVQQGFDQAFLDYFSVVDDEHAACGRAAIQGKRVIVEDVETDADFEPHRPIAAATGFRTVQSTPLFDRAGELLGVFSTHFREPHRFAEHELRLTDLYARQVAEMIGFKLAEEELRLVHEQLEARVAQRTRALEEANALLSVQVAERERAEQARQQLLGQLVSVQEEERQRISRELHDSLGQHLTALHLGLKAVQEQDGCSLHQAERLQQLRELALRLDDAVDRLSFELHPPALDDLGLEDALRQLVKEWSATSRIPVDVHTIQLGHRRLPLAIETTIYRIVQESLTNILKHAQAPHVSLIVERHTGEVRAIIEDNGRGFDLESVTNTSGARRPFGLTSIAERAALAGGQLDIETAPGAGTTIYMHAPLHPETGGGDKATDE